MARMLLFLLFLQKISPPLLGEKQK